MINTKPELLEKYPILKEKGLTINDPSAKFVEDFLYDKQ